MQMGGCWPRVAVDEEGGNEGEEGSASYRRHMVLQAGGRTGGGGC